MSTARALRRTYESLSIGDSASLKHAISAPDVASFARLSGDHNPLHVDATYAKATPFKKRVVHGLFLGSLVSQLIGMKLPGAYALLMKESLTFAKPVFIGDTVVVKASIVHKSDAARLIELSVEIARKGDMVASGGAHVRLLH